MSDTGGMLYAISADGHPYVKIGSTTGSPQERLKALQTGHPLRLRLCAVAPVSGNLLHTERAVHTFLRQQRKRGEWFVLDDMDDARLATLILEAIAYVDAHRNDPPVRRTPTEMLPTLDMTAFGKRLRAARLRADVTQTALATACAINLPNLNALERGKAAGARAETVLRLAWRLGVSTDYLLGLSAQEPPHA